jgi:hypothetical protein
MARDVDTTQAFTGIMRRVRRRRAARTVQKASLAVVVLLGTALSVAALFHAFGNRGVSGEGSTRIRMASTVLEGSFRVDLMAERTSGTDPVATVRAVALVRERGHWKTVGHDLVGRRDGWRWGSVTRGGGVCELAASDATPGVRVVVRLATSARGGCSAPQTLRPEG